MGPRPRALLTALALVLGSWTVGEAARRPRPVQDPPLIRRSYAPGKRTVQEVNGRPFTLDSYQRIRQAGLELLERFPPDKYFYLGVGRHPSTVIAFFETLSPDLALNFPAGGLGGQSKRKLVTGRLDNYKKHFEALIPQTVLQGQRKLLLLDYTSGPSVNNLAYALRRYLKEIGSRVAVKTFSFFDGNLVRTHYQTSHRDHSIFSLNYLNWEQLGRYAYNTHVIHSASATVESLQPNPRYEKLREAIKQHVASDRTLDRFLVKNLDHLLDTGRSSEGPAPAKKRAPAKKTAPAKRTAPAKKKATAKKNKPVPVKRNAPGSRAARWKIKDPFITKLRALDPGPIFHVRRSVKGNKQRYGMLARAAYDQYREAAVELMTRNPPDRSFYLGVGQTSSAIVALLENLDDKLAGYLPADGPLPPLSRRGEAALKPAFDANIPLGVRRTGRTIVLLQRDTRGEGLARVQALLQRYLAARGLRNKVVSVCLTELPTVKGVGRIDTRVRPFLQQLDSPGMQIVAAHGLTRPGIDWIPWVRRVKYGQLRRAMLKRMQRDATLHAWLQGAVDGQ